MNLNWTLCKVTLPPEKTPVFVTVEGVDENDNLVRKVIIAEYSPFRVFLWNNKDLDCCESIAWAPLFAPHTESGENLHGWIPCKKEPPPFGKPVLLTVDGVDYDGNPVRKVIIGEYQIFHINLKSGNPDGMNDFQLVAWSPVPAPYK